MSKELMKLADVMTLGESLAASRYFTDAKEASQAIVKVLAGQELGIGPVAAMSGLYIVKGKVTLSGNVMASLIKASAKYDYKIVNHTELVCEIEFFEKGTSIGVSDFSMDNAKQAGLSNGDNWKAYPRNMLFNRALSNGAKWFCPDLFNGQTVYTPEELGDESQDESEFIIENPTQNNKLPIQRSLSEYENVIIDFVLSLNNHSPLEKVAAVQEKVDSGEFRWPSDNMVTIADINQLLI